MYTQSVCVNAPSLPPLFRANQRVNQTEVANIAMNPPSVFLTVALCHFTTFFYLAVFDDSIL